MALVLCLAMIYSYADAQVTCPTPDSKDATLIPNPVDCNSYYACHEGEPILMKCPDGLHFNPKLRVCDWPSQAKCTVQEES